VQVCIHVRVIQIPRRDAGNVIGLTTPNEKFFYLILFHKILINTSKLRAMKINGKKKKRKEK